MSVNSVGKIDTPNIHVGMQLELDVTRDRRGITVFRACRMWGDRLVDGEDSFRKVIPYADYHKKLTLKEGEKWEGKVTSIIAGQGEIKIGRYMLPIVSIYVGNLRRQEKQLYGLEEGHLIRFTMSGSVRVDRQSILVSAKERIVVAGDNDGHIYRIRELFIGDELVMVQYAHEISDEVFEFQQKQVCKSFDIRTGKKRLPHVNVSLIENANVPLFSWEELKKKAEKLEESMKVPVSAIQLKGLKEKFQTA